MKAKFITGVIALGFLGAVEAGEVEVSETDELILIASPEIEAGIRKSGYVSGVYRQTFLDKKTGFRDPGSGLDIADFILEEGSDHEYRDGLSDRLVYRFGGELERGREAREVHGDMPKRKVEGPQICTQAGTTTPRVIEGDDFVAVKQSYTYPLAAPGRKAGSRWEQTTVFPEGKRYFVSSQRVTSVNSSKKMFYRIDMPGHVKHRQGDTFSEIYLSYVGRVSASEFGENFPPDKKFFYQREEGKAPERMIRAVRLRNAETGEDGPWLAGLVLDPEAVHEAWCHQRGYVCMILEFGGRPVKAGESFSAAFIVGYFDSIEEMEVVYDAHKEHRIVEASATGWELK